MTAQTVRYGNARLTVQESPDPGAGTELAEPLRRYEAGEISADDVAWSYLRARVRDHSASFTWEDADLERLLPAVVQNAPEAGLEHEDSWELAGALLERHLAARRQPASQTQPSPPAAEPPPAAGLLRRTGAGVGRGGRAAGRGLGSLGRGVRRVLPSRTRTRVLVGLGIVVLAAGIYGVNHYLTEVPDQLADDYREKAEPAVEQVTDAMDRTVASFDRYLDNYTVPLRAVRNAEEVEEIQRRFLPVYEDTEAALKAAERSIAATRKTLADAEDDLHGVPSAPLLGSKPPVVQAEDAVTVADEYYAQARNFLRNFQRFVDFDQKALPVRRADIQGLDDGDLSADASLEAVKAHVSEQLALAEKSRKRHLALKPHPDLERLYDISIEFSTILVDYYKDVQEALNSLSLAGLESADAELLASTRGLSRRTGYLTALFNSNSSIQKQSREMDDAGDELEETIRGLGTGEEGLAGDDRYRPSAPPRPPDPKPDRQDGGDRSAA